MLKVGQYHSPDGVVDVTPDRLRHWAANFSRLTDANQTVPMHFDHSEKLSELSPVSMSDFQQRKRSAANSVGRMTGFKLNSVGDAAEIQFEVNDPRAESVVKSNAAQLSPVIFPSWKDGEGNEYKDLITHLDIVNHPVDHSQSEAVCCSLIRMGVTPYRLSSDDPVEDEDDDEDLLNAALEGEDSLKDELPESDGLPPDDMADGGLPAGDAADNGELPNGDDDIESIALDGEGEIESPTESPIEADAMGGSEIGDLVLALAAHEIKLPDDTDSGNFLDRLKTALVATAEVQPQSADIEISQPQQGFMAMSLESYAHKSYRVELARELNGLLKSGRATPAEVRRQVDSLKAVKLSLTKSGDPAENAVSQFIANRKTLPEGAVWSSEDRLRKMSVVPQPDHATTKSGMLTGKALDDAVDLLTRR